jgi:integrase
MQELIATALPVICAKVSANTAKQYKTAARRLVKKLAEFEPNDVKPKHVAQVKLDMAATPNMANRCLSVLRQVFDYALEQQIVDSNPAIGIKRHAEKKRDRLPAIEELYAVYDKCGPRTRVIVDLLIRTGQRINDVLKIRRTDLLEDGIAFKQQKTGAKVIVPWTPELEEVVARAKALNGNIAALTLLHNRRGKAPDYRTVREQWTKACKAGGVADLHLHDLRAVAATWGEEQGKNATTLLGHTNAAQTVRYLRGRKPKVAEGPSFGQLLDKGAK